MEHSPFRETDIRLATCHKSVFTLVRRTSLSCARRIQFLSLRYQLFKGYSTCKIKNRKSLISCEIFGLRGSSKRIRGPSFFLNNLNLEKRTDTQSRNVGLEPPYSA